MKLLLCTIATASASWGDWNGWGTCQGTCYRGRRVRDRPCLSWDCELECVATDTICTYNEVESCDLDLCVWDQWSAWTTCSEDCGGGTQERERLCGGVSRPGEHCGGGETSETQPCNTAQCVSYSLGPWSDWAACSASCGGGTRERERDCTDNSGNVADASNCNGGVSETEACATDDCPTCQFNQWEDTWAYMSEYWNYVFDEEITSINDCSAYCAGISDCKAFMFYQFTYTNQNGRQWQYCYWTTSGEVRRTYDYSGWTSTSWTRTMIFGLKSTEDATQANLPSTSPTLEDCGVRNDNCVSQETGFGDVKYKDITNQVYYPYRWPDTLQEKFVETDSDTSDCAKKCFEKAGCSSFYVNDECNMVMGLSYPCNQYSSWMGCPDNADVTESGRLTAFCSNTDVFTTSFVKKSQFYCKFLTQLEEDALVQQIRDENGIDSSTQLGYWTYETVQEKPLSKKSQLIDLQVRNPYGDNTDTDEAWTWVQFTFETHTRTGTKILKSGRSPKKFFKMKEMEEFMENDMKSKQKGRHRRTTVDDIDEIDSDAINNVLQNLELPDDVEVIETTEPEVVEFSQVTPSGEVAADCSSGTCECADGYEDFGSGCEFVQSEEAPTVEASQFVLESLQGEIDSILDDATFSGKTQKQDRKRRNLKKAWKNLIDRIQTQGQRVQQNSCDFEDVDQDKFVLSGNACQKMKDAQNGLDYYSLTFTDDCAKENRGKNLFFYDRIVDRLEKQYDRVANHLNAGGNC